ncbi:Deoxynucleotidyltransferase terminal-interacting protein 2 [Armadillidium vulgare]|nr:Deoxynucleotidyltransferase terminal-interacting protein 2 [Armadillidium vulgare]
MGKVIDSPLDFFSSRIPKKQRKRTIAEEIMNSEEVLRYQKKKCSEIMEVRKTRTMKRKIASTDKRNVKKQKKEMRSNK